MLTNILNIIAITCSLGTSIFNKPKNAPIPTRDNQNFSSSLTKDSSANGTINLGNSTANTYHLIQLNSEDYRTTISHLNIHARRYMIFGIYREGENDTRHIPYYVSNAQIESTPSKDLIDINSYNYPCVSELLFFEYESELGLRNFEIDVGSTIYFAESTQNYTPKLYTETIYTYNDLSTYLNLSITSGASVGIWDNITENNNFYDKFNEIRQNEVGYQSTYKANNITLETTSQNNFTFEQIEEPLITYSKKLYCVMYRQYYYRKIGTTTYISQIETPFNDPRADQATNNVQPLLGYIEGQYIINTGDTEVIDIPGVMFTVLGMPFTFISTAFNLTIFPGTPYQVNISLLFLAIFGILVFVFLLRLILSKLR